jgi:hypothetical protein
MSVVLVTSFTLSSGSLSQSVPTIIDTPFWQDYHEPHPLSTPEENDVRSIALDGQGRVWVATADGVRFLQDGNWKTPPGGKEVGLCWSLYTDGKGIVWAGAWNGLYKLSRGGVEQTEIRGTAIGAVGGKVFSSGEQIIAAGSHGIWRLRGGKWTKIEGSWNTNIRAVRPATENSIWIATGSGLYLQDLSALVKPARLIHKPDALLSSNLYDIAEGAGGSLWFGSTGGIDIYDGQMRAFSFTASNGLPNRQARAIAFDQDRRAWVATKLGVARLDDKKWSLRHSRRWLLSDDVRDVAIGKDGTAWVATDKGVSAIRRKRMTLAQKAEHYLRILRARHIRPPGLVGPAVLRKQGDLSDHFIEDDDNDGEHTSMYLAIESWRYAVTKAPDARENAKAAFHALEQLQRVTGTNHFIARSMLPIGTPPLHEVDRTFTPQEIADSYRTEPREKIIEKRWVPSADGKWVWKRDASSDEVDGHMFGYSTYFDLAADDVEKKRVAEHVDRIMGGIVDHGFILQDIDGKATRWGVWSPEKLNGDPNWHEEQAGNSVEILGFLGIAHHMTGKQKYVDATRLLIDKHGYAKNVLNTNFDTPSERTHIEDELLSLTYPGFINHIIDRSLLPTFQESIRRWHKTCETEGSPLYDFVYNRWSGRTMPLEAAHQRLIEWPLDMIEWTVDNRSREDVQVNKTPGLDEGFLDRILPGTEMGIQNWDQEPYMAVIGRDGMREDRTTDWLLAYWMGRYYGFIK